MAGSDTVRIAIDARLLEARDIGSAVYARAVLGALGRTPDRHEYLLICRPGARAVLGFAPQFEWVELEEARLMDERWEQLALPELLAGAEADVYFSLTSVLPAIKTSPQVTIIHDVGFEEEPGFYESSLRRYLSTWLRAAAQQADYVITVSEHSKAAISRVYGVPDDRILVAHPAPDHIFQPIQEQSRKAVLDLYGLQEPYLLSVAVLEPNKNVKAILEGYQIAGGRAGLQRPLALVGAPGRAAPQLHRAIERLGLGEEVRILGYVPREHLPAIFSGASCFLWASLYEGFGLPPLEAMACGTEATLACLAEAARDRE